MERATGFELRARRWLGYALGILTESGYVISILLMILLLALVIFRWF